VSTVTVRVEGSILNQKMNRNSKNKPNFKRKHGFNFKMYIDDISEKTEKGNFRVRKI